MSSFLKLGPSKNQLRNGLSPASMVGELLSQRKFEGPSVCFWAHRCLAGLKGKPNRNQPFWGSTTKRHTHMANMSLWEAPLQERRVQLSRFDFQEKGELVEGVIWQSQKASCNQFYLAYICAQLPATCSICGYLCAAHFESTRFMWILEEIASNHFCFDWRGGTIKKAPPRPPTWSIQ